MADVAQFGVEIPPVKGASEAEGAFERLSRAAQQLDKAVQGVSRQIQGANGPFAAHANAARNLTGGLTNAQKAAYNFGYQIGQNIRNAISPGIRALADLGKQVIA